jgi:hypothetical protein
VRPPTLAAKSSALFVTAEVIARSAMPHSAPISSAEAALLATSLLNPPTTISIAEVKKRGSSGNRVGDFGTSERWKHACQDLEPEIFLISQPVHELYRLGLSLGEYHKSNFNHFSFLASHQGTGADRDRDL